MTDFNLIIQAQFCLLWAQECQNPKNSNKNVSQLLRVFNKKHQNIPPLNKGSLIMASYILFVYPKENELTEEFLNKIDTSKFNIIDAPINAPLNSAFILRKLRNSLAHGKFIDENNFFTFEDWEEIKGSQDRKFYFKATIGLKDFGVLINNFFSKTKELK